MASIVEQANDLPAEKCRANFGVFKVLENSMSVYPDAEGYYH